MRRRGGGAKRLYRIVDFKRKKFDVEATVVRIEYDPNRTANIALLKYADGERRYIIAPGAVKAGDQLMSGTSAPIRAGNTMPLRNIPLGSVIHCIELKPGKGAQMIRSAGTSAQLVAKEGGYVTLRLPSGETRMVPSRCMATIGTTSNPDHANVDHGKAGRKRWLGVRPKTRGVAMNPVDHPMGGGEGKSSGGHPRSPSGVPAKGFKTRKKRKQSNKMIIRRRGKK